MEIITGCTLDVDPDTEQQEEYAKAQEDGCKETDQELLEDHTLLLLLARAGVLVGSAHFEDEEPGCEEGAHEEQGCGELEGDTGGGLIKGYTTPSVKTVLVEDG